MRQATPITAALEHVVFYPDEKRDTYPTVIALHGRGADAPDLVPLISEIGRYDLLVVAPRAPIPWPMGGYAWYQILEEARPDPQMLSSSLHMLTTFLDEVKKGYPVDRNRVILLGFSQGAAMAYTITLENPRGICGAVVLSGFMPLKSGIVANASKLKGFPVFISHGTLDPMIPVRYGREAKEILTNAGAQVSYHEYTMGHQVLPETLTDLAGWFDQLLSG